MYRVAQDTFLLSSINHQARAARGWVLNMSVVVHGAPPMATCLVSQTFDFDAWKLDDESMDCQFLRKSVFLACSMAARAPASCWQRTHGRTPPACASARRRPTASRRRRRCLLTTRCGALGRRPRGSRHTGSRPAADGGTTIAAFCVRRWRLSGAFTGSRRSCNCGPADVTAQLLRCGRRWPQDTLLDERTRL
jgi:hypothetical protein